MKAFLSVLLICMLFAPAALGEALPGEVTASPAVMPAPTPAHNAASASPTLSATGSARVSVRPDIAVLTFAVQITASTVTEAQDTTTATLDTLYAALEPLGITTQDIHTSFYDVDTQYSYQYGKLGQSETPSGYSVSSDVIITLPDVNLIGEVIDLALQSGANNSYELRFQSSQSQAAYDKALSLAAEEAMRKAALLADVTHVTLGDVLSIREVSGSGSQAYSRVNLDGTSNWSGLHYMLDVEASVEATYSIR